MTRRPLVALAALALIGTACGGRLVPSPVEGEPVCADFDIGATHGKMRGSLRHPVFVTILERGKTISRATLSGLRAQGDPVSRILLPDDNGEYEVRWAQCENERAPRPVTTAVESKEAAHYECGKAEVYKTEQLVTKKGDPSSRKLLFAPPPDAGCWTSEAPEEKAPPPPPPPPAEPADAGADASAAAEGTATPDAAPPPDAGQADAGKSKKKKK